MQTSNEEPLLRIQREISEVVERENELRKRYNGQINGLSEEIDSIELNSKEITSKETIPNEITKETILKEINSKEKFIDEQNNNNCNTFLTSNSPSDVSKSPSPPPRIIQRAFSTSVLSFNTGSTVLAPPKRYPEQRGIMQRFIKSRGKLSLPTVVPLVRDPMARSWSIPVGDDPLLKVHNIPPEKLIRKGYIPVEERIQKELREMQNREAELKAYRRKTLATSQPDLLKIINGDDEDTSANGDSPPSTPKLRGARSFLHLCDLESASAAHNQIPTDTVSAPSSLRPAVSLAQLCDDLDESEVPSSSELIAKFESIIQRNLTNGNAVN